MFHQSPTQPNALTRLAFLAQRRPQSEYLLEEALRHRLDELVDVALEVAVDVGDPLGKVLVRRLEAEGTFALVEHLVDRLSGEPYASVLTLREVSVVALRRCLEHYKQMGSERDEETQPILAALIFNLAQDLDYLGHWNQALEMYEEGIAAVRSAKEPAPSLLASYLLEYGSLQNKMGHLDRDLTAIREAVSLRRRLAEDAADDGESRLALANALSNLAGALSDLGDVRESLRTVEEAMGIFEAHHDELDDFALHRLANVLICRGNQLDSLGQEKEALHTLERAVKIRRQLAADRPAAFEPEFALALTDFALALYNSDRYSDARRALEEATTIYQRLARGRPAAFDPALAWAVSRNLLDIGLKTPQQQQQILNMLEQAVQLIRNWVKEHPRAFEPQLAEALLILADQYQAAGRPQAALASIGEAHGLLRRSLEDPVQPRERLLYYLGWSFLHRSEAHDALGDTEAAHQDADRSRDIFQQLPQELPTSGRSLAAAQHQLGLLHLAAGRFAEGLRATAHSVELYGTLAAKQPGVYRTELAAALLTLGGLRHALGDLKASAESSSEALALCRELVDHRRAFADLLALALNNLGLALYHLGQLEEALPLAREAACIFQDLAEEYLIDEEHLADCENNLGIILSGLEQFEEAQGLLESAIARRQRLAENLHTPAIDLAFSLTNLGVVQAGLGHGDEAVRAGLKSAEILRPVVEAGRADLSSRLGVTLGNVAIGLRKLSRPQEAVPIALEALHYLAPQYDALPDVMQRATLTAIGNYLEGSKELGIEPDYELLKPFLLPILKVEIS